MPASISGYNSAAAGSTPRFLVGTQGWRAVYSSDGTTIALGVNNWGSIGPGNPSGVAITVAGIDPVIEFLLATRLPSTGQIWPAGVS